ncbi:transporter [Polaribacter gangjinensis]|uniref:Transporter n=1 Tax=Polaribacter gangjinensis TaxID=574710 RepID=A0A2S7WB40_9FLAO|nr:transporter [Polaribacter gangjinensis]PQJ74858.1 hypothetical protein BTO13_06175 [Polaribacter gangjinensis]
MKKPKILFAIVILFLGFESVFAQYTDVINSNKPGFSESPYSVGTGVYQFENSLFLRNLNTDNSFSVPKSFGFDMLFRTSFFLERLELNAQMSLQRDQIFSSINPSEKMNVTGFGRFVIGAKYLIFEQKYEDKSKEVRSWVRRNAFDKKRLIPSVAVYAGVNTDFVSENYKTGSMSPKFGILLQNDLTNEFNLITNIFYDKVGTDFPEFSYIITATQNFNQRWSGFIENQTIFQENFNHTNIGGGLAYLFTKNMQFNASARFLAEGNASGFYGSLGVSYRIDKHKDSFINVDDNGNEISDTPISRYNKKQGSFFSRIFGSKNKNQKKSNRKRTKRRRNN